MVKYPGVVGKLCFLTVVRTYPAVGQARSRPRLLNQFSYRCRNWASTELVKIYLTTPKKFDLYQQTPNSLPILLPTVKTPRVRYVNENTPGTPVDSLKPSRASGRTGRFRDAADVRGGSDGSLA